MEIHYVKLQRNAGDYAHKEPGNVYMEDGGPDGALVLFNPFRFRWPAFRSVSARWNGDAND